MWQYALKRATLKKEVVEEKTNVFEKTFSRCPPPLVGPVVGRELVRQLVRDLHDSIMLRSLLLLRFPSVSWGSVTICKCDNVQILPHFRNGS